MYTTPIRHAVALACALAPTLCFAQSVWFSGWPHQPEGAATIALNPAGELTVSNIGSSGLDGVCIDYPPAEAFQTEWSGISIINPEVRFEQVVTSQMADGSEIITHRIALENNAGVIHLFADNGDLGIPGGPTMPNVRVTIVDDGIVQGTVVVPQGQVAEIISDSGSGIIVCGATTTSDANGHVWFERLEPGTKADHRDGYLFDSGLILYGNAVYTSPAGTLPMEIVGITETQFLLANTGNVKVDTESRVSERLRHKARGAAHAEPSTACSDCIVINNIGDTGDDGVEFELRAPATDPIHPPDPVQGFQIAMPQSQAMKVRPLNDRVLVSATGNADGPAGPIFDTEIIALELTGVGGIIPCVRVEPDFSMLGATTMVVAAYRDGAPVFQTVLPLGTAADIQTGSPTSAVDTCWIDVSLDVPLATIGPVVVSIGGDPNDPWTLTIPGGPTVVADALHMSPIGQTTVPTEMVAMSLTGENLQPFAVDLRRTRQTPKTDFGSVLKKGFLRNDIVSDAGPSGQTSRVEVRGWNPKEKKAIVGHVPSTEGVGLSLGFDRVIGAVHTCEFDTQDPDTGAAESFGLSFEVLAGNWLRISQNPTVPFGPTVCIVEARNNDVAVARRVYAPPFPTNIAQLAFLDGSDVGLDFSARGFENGGNSLIYDLRSDQLAGVMLPGATFPVPADELRVAYEGLATTPYPFTMYELGTDTPDSGALFMTKQELILNLAAHTAQGMGVLTSDPAQLASKKLFVGGLSWDTSDDGVAIVGHPWSIPARYNLPEVEDEVLVSFAHADPLNPVVIGSLWNAECKTAPNGAAGKTMAELRGIRTADAHEISLNFPFALPERTVTILNNGVEVGTYIVFGNGVQGRLPPPGSPPTTPDGIVGICASTSDDDGNMRVKVKFPWVRVVESPDSTTTLSGDEMCITAPPIPSRFGPFAPVREMRITGMHIPAFAIDDVQTNAYPCGADVTTQGAGAGDPGFGVPDGFVTGADINYFVNAWVAGNAVVADITTQGAGLGDPLFGVPDGLVTGADINLYVNLWIAGCP